MSEEKQVAAPTTTPEAPTEVHDLSNPEVVNKYRAAADIANLALNAVKALCKPGAKIVDLCKAGDEVILEHIGKTYNVKKNGVKIEKGIGFPTSVSVNHVAGHFSPLKDHKAELKARDLVKVDLGVHIDGYIALLADTFAVWDEAEAKNAEVVIDGKIADLMHATNTAMEAALRALKPGNKNFHVSDALGRVADSYKISLMQGVLSHNLERNVLDGNKVILNKMEGETKIDEIDFYENEVYALDIVMSTGDGRPKEVKEKTTVFKRAENARYKLKLKASNYLLSQVKEKSPYFPFSLRNIDDETKARLGITELVSHGLVQEYPVLEEAAGEYIAQLKATVLLTANGTQRITGTQIDLTRFKTDKVIENEELKGLLAQPLKKSKKAKNKKKEETKQEVKDAAAAAPAASS